MIFGLLIAAFIYYSHSISGAIATVTFVAVIFTAVVIADAASRGIRVPLFSYLISKLEREDAFPGKGTIFFFISTLFCLAFFGSESTVIAIVMLAVLDSISTVAGISFGKKKIYNNKSLEGTACGIGAGFVVMLFFTGPINAIILAAAAGITELVSPVDDNLTIPPVTCIMLWIIGAGFI